MYWSRRTSIAIPVAMLLLGGILGWFMRDSAPASSTSGTAVGRALPTGAALDAQAPPRTLAPATNTMVIDRTNLIGYPSETGTRVPAGAVVPLNLDSKGGFTPLDARTLTRAAEPAPPNVEPQQPHTLSRAPAPSATPNTQPPAETTTTLPGGHGGFKDPCTAPKRGCPGGEGRVQPAPTDAAAALAPLEVSMPFAAAGAYSSMCDRIEGNDVPETFLNPAVRPTIAVVVNQPSSIAVSGTWGDGAPMDKLTMVTSPDFDKEWQAAWQTDHVQKSLLACITVPLDDVRPHAAGGRAPLRASVLAISATGRAELDGPLALTIPLDGEDTPFDDQVTIRSLGEQVQTDGTLAPAVHVHYAVLDDQVVPTSSRLNARTAKVYSQHALVENADCAGWANNQQGIDRTAFAEFTVAKEQRTVAGRVHNATVVDGDLTLDPSLPGGWSGYACVRLFVADADGHQLSVALRGAPVRSPRTAVYTVGAVLDPLQLPDGYSIAALWTRADGTEWCSPIELGPKAKGAACTTAARSMPDGIRLVLRARDKKGALQPAFVVTVPVNTAYCNTDDPFAWQSDGCATGFTEPLKMPIDAKGRQSADITLVVAREVAQGSIANNPSHTWQIAATQSFIV